jgi:hypothetical protein
MALGLLPQRLLLVGGGPGLLAPGLVESQKLVEAVG